MGNKKQLTPRLNRLEPNIIIDGGFEVWPEGTSIAVSNAAKYGSVLMKLSNLNSGATVTESQQASVPVSSNAPFSSQSAKTAAGTLAANTAIVKSYFVEGYDTLKMFQSEWTLVFWVKSSVASSRTVGLYANSTHSYLKQYSISAANTWELKAIKFPALSTSPASINRTNGLGLQVNWNIVSGSTYQSSTQGSWLSGQFFQVTGEDTTWLTGTNHDFSLSGVMILSGDWSSLATNTSQYTFLRTGRNFQEELIKTRRYYEKSYSLSTVPGVAGGSNDFDGATRGYSAGTGIFWSWIQFKEAKRATPTMTYYNPNTGSTSTPLATDGSGNVSIVNVATSDSGNSVERTGLTANTACRFHWSADARF
jgi:hypothetical protein